MSEGFQQSRGFIFLDCRGSHVEVHPLSGASGRTLSF